VLPNAATRRNCGYGEIDVAAEIQELYNTGISMPFGEERDEIFRQIQALAIDNVLIIPVYNGATTRLISSRIGGLAIDSTGAVRLSYIVLR
jgi:ABC-type transport system substrate-binding protein